MKRYRVVTVDFDNTLLFQRFSMEYNATVDWFVNHDLVRELQRMIADGTKVFIVTARAPWQNRDTIIQTPPERFVQEQKLPVSGIYYTNGEFKVDTLLALRSELHFDDSDEEMIAIMAHAPQINRVLIEEPNAGPAY